MTAIDDARERRMRLVETAFLGALAAWLALFYDTYDVVERLGWWRWYAVAVVVFAVIRALWLLRWEAAASPSTKRLARIGGWIFVSPMPLPFLWQVFLGVSILTVIAWRIAAVWAALHIAAIPLIWILVRKGRWAAVHARVAVIVAVAANGILWPGVSAWLWRPPAVEDCAALERPGVVERLTPIDSIRRASYVYDIEVLPESHAVAATFKMGGNLVLNFWNDPEANRLYVVDAADAPSPRVADVPMGPDLLPENMVYLPGTHALYVVMVGTDRWEVRHFQVDGPDDVRSVGNPWRLDREPQSLVRGPGDAWIGIVPMHVASPFSLRDPGTGAVAWEKRVDVSGLNILHVHQPAGSTKFYWLGAPRRIYEIDGRERSVRSGPPGFYVGYIEASPPLRLLLQTDVVFDTLNVFDLSTLNPVRSVDLPFKPRALAVAPEIDVVFLGDWFGGGVRPYSTRTWEPMGGPVETGPYLRAMAWDPQTRMVYAGSKCGLSRIRVEAAWPGLTAGAAPSD